MIIKVGRLVNSKLKGETWIKLSSHRTNKSSCKESSFNEKGIVKRLSLSDATTVLQHGESWIDIYYIKAAIE